MLSSAAVRVSAYGRGWISYSPPRIAIDDDRVTAAALAHACSRLRPPVTGNSTRLERVEPEVDLTWRLPSTSTSFLV